MIKDRIKELRRVKASDLRANPKNWRTHPDAQRTAMQGFLADIGWADALIAYETEAGGLELIDGHLRAEIAPDQEVPVLILDVDEQEANTILAALDPLTLMAQGDISKLDELLAEVQFESEAVTSMLTELSATGKAGFDMVSVAIGDLKEHPRNYREHPEDQLAHIKQSIEEHGFYRNVVVAKDNTILAGHGVVLAARQLGKERIPVIRLDIAPDDPRALKVLTSDNEIARLAEVDDRALTELLKGLLETEDEEGLLGTGFDPQQLAALTMVTRPQSEIRDKNDAAEWIGMPEYGEAEEPLKLVVSFQSEEDRARFVELAELKLKKKTSQTWSAWWPERENDDASSVKFKTEL